MRSCPVLLLPLAFLIGCTGTPHHEDHTRTQQIVSSNTTASITDVRVWSQSLDAPLSYRIIIPTHPLGERLPVLYFLHGANSGPEEIVAQSPIKQLAAAAHLIVIIPQAETSYYTNAQHLRHAYWENAITTDLPHDAIANFPIHQGREHTGIAGISMGGYGAIKLSLKHPELYSFIGDMSGPLDITRRPVSFRRWSQTTRNWSIFGYLQSTRLNEDVFHLLTTNLPRNNTTWFASCGQDDPLSPVNLHFVRRLNESGTKLEILETPGGHDWRSWNAAMPELFRLAGMTLR